MDNAVGLSRTLSSADMDRSILIGRGGGRGGESPRSTLTLFCGYKLSRRMYQRPYTSSFAQFFSEITLER